MAMAIKAHTIAMLLFAFICLLPPHGLANKQSCGPPAQCMSFFHGRDGRDGRDGKNGAKGDKGEAGKSCSCKAQNTAAKPSAHIEGPRAGYHVFKPGKDIGVWTPSTPRGHLAGGMTFSRGRLTVPRTGRYYIYAQAYFNTMTRNKEKRISIQINGNRIALAMPHYNLGFHGTGYTGGVFILRANDVISVRVEDTDVRIYMGQSCTYFGAFMI